MSDGHHEPNLFRVLLRHQRQRRGMSQLDLSLAAQVSSRHISFLETGRAQPSRDMILRLSAALGLGLREVNALLQAASLPRAFVESAAEQPWPAPIENVIQRMLKQQEPYPMVVLNGRYDVLRMNQAAGMLLRYVHDPAALVSKPNLLHCVFSPRLFRPYIANWVQLAQLTLAQLQREVLASPMDPNLPALMRELFTYPDVPDSWRMLSFDLPPTAAFEFTLSRDGQCLRFMTTLTNFNSAIDAGLEELRFESYFPADEATDSACRAAATH